MQKLTHRSIARVLAIAGLSIPAGAGALTFTPLGDLAGGDFSSAAYDVSADGNVVVGTSSAAQDFQVFRWTAGTGIQPLTPLPDFAGGGDESRGLATDADGSRVVGQGTTSAGSEAFYWDAPAGAFNGLGYLDPSGNPLTSIANGVSANGSVIVGRSNSPTGNEAFIWDAGGGIRSLGDFTGGAVSSTANAVSADGTIVVGAGAHFGGPSASEAAMWINEGPIIGLGSLSGGVTQSRAMGISADGSTVVGAASSAASAASAPGALEAFRWTSVLGNMEGLGDLPGGDFSSEAHAASADGSVIVGRATIAGNDSRAFLWTAASGMVDLTVLAASVLPAGWALEEAYGISADGLTIVGGGSNSDGNNEAWILRLDFTPVPEPGTALLVALGLVAIGARRRR